MHGGNQRQHQIVGKAKQTHISSFRKAFPPLSAFATLRNFDERMLAPKALHKEFPVASEHPALSFLLR